jgi:hypothetical protein
MKHLLSKRFVPLLFLALVFLGSCKKEEPVYEDNTIPPYSEIPTIEVNNYVNRLFIDIIGREPTDEEMDRDTEHLEENDLSVEARIEIINTLFFSTDPVEGDTSYNHAYFTKLYEDTKARLIEGASDAEISQQYNVFRNNAIADSLAGNIGSYEQNMVQANRLKDILDSPIRLREGTINIRRMYEFMLFNSIYDQINMGAFNFINATFNDLFYRFPTEAEFEQSFEIIEFNQPAQIFGQVAQNKSEYIDIMTESDEYEEGMVRWAFQTFLSREPSTAEVSELAPAFGSTSNLQSIQRQILITDEYAGFEN